MFEVSITKPSPDGVVEPSERIEFAASVDFSGRASLSFRWSSDDVDVDDTSLFSTGSRSLWLVARAGAFGVGSRYTFQFAAWDTTGHNRTVNVTVVANSPPHSGSFSVVPNQGGALTTLFHFASRGWLDRENNLPLAYSFGYVSSWSGAQISVGSSPIGVSNSTLPASSNLSVVVYVSDQLGGMSTQTSSVAVSLASDASAVVLNATAQISGLIAQGFSDAATAMVASCSEMLNEHADENAISGMAAAMRADLLSLLWNATAEYSAAATSTISLRAATLELLVGVPTQVERATLESGIIFAAAVVNQSSHIFGQIPKAARGSIVNALSSTVEAGVLSSEVASGVGAEGSISAVLHQLHMAWLSDAAPGEDPITTTSRFLALSSSEASCTYGECLDVRVDSPRRLSLNATSNDAGSFSLDASTLSEIATSSACQTSGGVATIGLMAVAWSVNPHQANGSSIGAKDNVTSLKITSCHGTVAVENLSSPIIISLPFKTLDAALTTREVHVQACEVTGQVLTFPCTATGEEYPTVCPAAEAIVNFTCPVASVSPTCCWWDEIAESWRTDGCKPLDVSSHAVTCSCTHLTDFASSLDIDFAAGKTVLTNAVETDENDFAKVGSVLFILTAVYSIVGFIFVRDRALLREYRRRHYATCWKSNVFQSSIQWLHEHILSDDASDTDQTSYNRRSARDSHCVAERAMQLESQHVQARQQLFNMAAPSIQLCWCDFIDNLKHEHLVLAIFYRNHASNERAYSVLIRLISLLFGSTLKYTIIKSATYGVWRAAMAEGFHVLVREFGIAITQTFVVMAFVLPFRKMMVAALHVTEDKILVREMREDKLIIDGLSRIKPKSTTPCVDLHASIFAAQAIGRIADARLGRARALSTGLVSMPSSVAKHHEDIELASVAISDADMYEKQLNAILKQPQVQHREHHRGSINILQYENTSAGLSSEDWARVVLSSLPTSVVQRRVQQRNFMHALRNSSWIQRTAAARLLHWRPVYHPAVTHVDERGRRLPPERDGLPVVEIACTSFGVIYILCVPSDCAGFRPRLRLRRHDDPLLLSLCSGLQPYTSWRFSCTKRAKARSRPTSHRPSKC